MAGIRGEDAAGTWDAWLAEEDSVRPLAPEGYDEGVALVCVKALRDRLKADLSEHEVRAAGPELYQDSTGLAHFRITAKGDTDPRASVLAWVVISRFGKLTTVFDCKDPQLLAAICSVLKDVGLKYIPDDYLKSKPYAGKCKSLWGFSWANRYLSLTSEFNEQYPPDYT